MALRTVKPVVLVAVVVVLAAGLYGASHHASSHSVSVVQARTAPSDSQLQSIAQQWSGAQSFSNAVIVHELNGKSRSAAINPDKQVVTASVYKLFAACAVLHQIEVGKMGLGTTLSTGQTVQAALTKMITQSDNDSAEALGFKVGWQNINQYATSIGATHTNINNYDSTGNYTSAEKVTTARDVDMLLTKLQNGKLLNTSNTSLLFGLMKQQVWRERVPAGVPIGTSVADKPGWLSPADGYSGYVENDAAIVYGPKSTYILVVMTSSATTQPLANLSQQVYNYLES